MRHLYLFWEVLPMRLPRSAAALALIGTAAAGIAAAGPAAAAPATPEPPSTGTPASTQEAKTQVLRTVDRDLYSLRLYSYAIAVNPWVPEGETAMLQTPIHNDTDALSNLRTTVTNETTVEDVGRDSAALEGYHVEDFVLPRSALIVRSDELTVAAFFASLTQAALQKEITDAQTAGADVTKAQDWFEDYAARVAAAGAGSQAVHSAATDLSLSGVPDNGSTLKSSATDLRTVARGLDVAGREAALIERHTKPKTGTTEVGQH
jgi:hypothetical protein